MILTEQLLTVARSYCHARGLSLARVSTLVFNDGKKLEAIASRGADLATGRFESTMGWFSANWPSGVDWPAHVARPEIPAANLPNASADHTRSAIEGGNS